MQKRFFIANFKMNGTRTEAAEYFKLFPKIPADYPHTVVFCPPFTALDITRSAGFRAGAQNIHAGPAGAFTGEISARMVADAGAEFVILGHSERRTYFNETDAVINEKIKTAIAGNLTVILCISTPEQIKPALRGVGNLGQIILAYEPPAAIGTGCPAAPGEIAAVAETVRKTLPDVPLLYGGSVNENNVNEILSVPGIDGVLVGGACLDPVRFAKICGLL